MWLPMRGVNVLYWLKRNTHLKCRIHTITRVRMRRDFFNQLIEKYFEQLIGSVRVLQPHCCNFKANDFEHYCAAACAGTCQALMGCTAALDEWVHQTWRNLFALEC